MADISPPQDQLLGPHYGTFRYHGGAGGWARLFDAPRRFQHDVHRANVGRTMAIELGPCATAFVPGGSTEWLRLTAGGAMRSIAETLCA